jgi:hypothetical protein
MPHIIGQKKGERIDPRYPTAKTLTTDEVEQLGIYCIDVFYGVNPEPRTIHSLSEWNDLPQDGVQAVVIHLNAGYPSKTTPGGTELYRQCCYYHDYYWVQDGKLWCGNYIEAANGTPVPGSVKTGSFLEDAAFDRIAKVFSRYKRVLVD